MLLGDTPLGVSGASRNRFTIDGSAELEQHLKSVCEAVRDGVQEIIPTAQLEGILLGGGYGRGEGGVLSQGDRALPYNDIEFFVFVRGVVRLADAQYGRRLHQLGEELSRWAGAEVEFKITSRAKVQGATPSMFFYDLCHGHRLVLGDDDLLAGCEHHKDATALPLHEVTRLLFNRCSGLLFASERLRRVTFSQTDAEFVQRNLAKAELAFGDVALAALGRYHWSCRERSRRLEVEDIPFAKTLRPLHRQGVAFKLRPTHPDSSLYELSARHSMLCVVGLRLFLWLESMRLGKVFSSAREYAFDSMDKCPETAAWHNGLVSLATLGWRGAGFSYPRQRLLNSLAVLLWDRLSLQKPEVARFVGSELLSPSSAFPALVGAYAKLWNRFN